MNLVTEPFIYIQRDSKQIKANILFIRIQEIKNKDLIRERPLLRSVFGVVVAGRVGRGGGLLKISIKYYVVDELSLTFEIFRSGFTDNLVERCSNVLFV